MKSLLLSVCLVLLSGMSYGVHETLNYHHSAFRDRFPKAGIWWNPKESWRLKYAKGRPENGPYFPGSTTVFATFTDAKHLFSSLHVWSLAIGVLWLYGSLYLGTPFPGNNIFGKWVKKMGFWEFTIYVAIVALGIRAVGFHLTYTLLFL